ncbi:MAG: MFS transporter [Cytophagales bacterium]|nr:MAG: MFS transporter [Cytophagales bacterium]
MNLKIRSQLSLMMFIEYFVWGSWYVTMGTYLTQTLKFDGVQVGVAYSALSIAAIISPFFVGMIADRFFAAERALGVLHIIGGILMYLISNVSTFDNFYPLLFAYTLCYMPTLALTNAVCFHQMNNPSQEFPNVRVFGTVGWIVAGLMLSFLKVEASVMQMTITAGLSFAMGIYSFTLPHTPPKKKGEKVTISDVLGLEALALMKNPSFAIVVIASILICIPLSFYYNFTNLFLNELGMENAAGKMTMGQASEFFFLLVMPLFFVRLGVKKMIMFGMAAWAVRYLLFAFGNTESAIWMLYLGIVLHGICYDFFFVTGQIYVDNKAPEHLKSAAQGMITMATYGIGMFVGSLASGKVLDAYTIDATIPHDWQSIWIVPAALALMVLLLFAFFFKEEKQK